MPTHLTQEDGITEDVVLGEITLHFVNGLYQGYTIQEEEEPQQ
jgi:hypothetical protein